MKGNESVLGEAAATVERELEEGAGKVKEVFSSPGKK
jgi:hypothetical protein